MEFTERSQNVNFNSSTHFNQSLSRDKTILTVAIFKWKLRVKHRTPSAGERRRYVHVYEAKKTIVVSISQIEKLHDYTLKNCMLREFLLVRIPMKTGLRSGEVLRLRVDYFDFQNRLIKVYDTKKKVVWQYPLPVDAVTLDYVQQYIRQERTVYGDGTPFLFYSKTWRKGRVKPLTGFDYRALLRKICSEVGLPYVRPTMFRHYFAAKWVKAGKSIEGLRRILRHANLLVTHRYLQRLFTLEDLQREYDDVRRLPFETVNCEAGSLCSSCRLVEICKFAPLPPVVASCRRYQQKRRLKTYESGNRSACYGRF